MKILLATDGSEFSESAAGFLNRFDFSRKDEIIVLHVISEVPYDDDYHAKIKKFIKRFARRILEPSVTILKSGKARVRGMEEDGYPDVTILEVAKNEGVDLVVAGARGIKGVQSLFLGSVTRSIAINSPSPVLVVKSPPWEEPMGMRVLFATDGSDTALETAGVLASLPFPPESELRVMNVSWSSFSDIPERFAIEIDSRMKDDVAAAKKIEIQEAQKTLDRGKKVLEKRFDLIHDVIKFGDPASEILYEAIKAKSDIIAVGCRGLKGIKGMLGSVSRRVLGHSQCSVLIGKKGKR